MIYITILNFQDGRVYQYELQEDQHSDLEEYIVDKGFSLGNIEWMSHSDKTIY